MSDKESIPNFTLNNHLEGDDKKEPKVIKAGFINSHLSSRRDFIKKGLFFGAGLVTSTSFLGCGGGGDDNSSVASGAGPVQNISSFCNWEFNSSHKGAIPSVAFSPDGSKIVSVSTTQYNLKNYNKKVVPGKDSFVKLWETSTQKLLLTYDGHESSVYDVSFSPDGKKIATGGKDNIIDVWDSSTGELLIRYEGHVNSNTNLSSFGTISFSPDGTKIASSFDNSRLHIWDTLTGELILNYTGLRDVQTIDFHPDGTKIAAGGWASYAILYAIHIFDISDGSLILSYEGHKSEYGIRKLDFSPDGNTIASICVESNPVHVWNVSDGKLLFEYDRHNFRIHDITFTPDGEKIITHGDDETIQIVDSSTGELLLKNESVLPKDYKSLLNDNSFESLAVSPDGKLIASSSWEYLFTIDSNSGELLNYFLDTSNFHSKQMSCDSGKNDSLVSCSCDIVCNCDSVCTCDSVCSCHGVCSCDIGVCVCDPQMY